MCQDPRKSPKPINARHGRLFLKIPDARMNEVESNSRCTCLEPHLFDKSLLASAKEGEAHMNQLLITRSSLVKAPPCVHHLGKLTVNWPHQGCNINLPSASRLAPDNHKKDFVFTKGMIRELNSPENQASKMLRFPSCISLAMTIKKTGYDQ